jgi:hypothetical protein
MLYEPSSLDTSSQMRDMLEALWTLEDLHRQLIKQVHRYVTLQEGTFGKPITQTDLAGLL